MRWIHLTASCICGAAVAAGCNLGPEPPRNFSVVEPVLAEGDLAPILKAEAAKAHAMGRKPFVELEASWCGPCKALKRSLDDPLMQQAFSGTYIIQIDVDQWESQLRSAGFTIESFPVFHEINSEGKPTGRSIDGGAWEENIPANMAPPLQKFFNGE